MSEDSEANLLGVVHNIVLELIGQEDQLELKNGLALIESICRYRTDVRNKFEQEKYCGETVPS